jgi:DNA (cytosine-5)-methyltransferase 1
VQFPRPTHGKYGENDLVSAGEALESLPEPDNPDIPSEKYYELLNDIPAGLNYSFYTKKRGCPDPIWSWREKFSDFLLKSDPKSPCRTIKATDGDASGPFHWNNRRFTKNELKKLQSFPANFEIPVSRNKAKLRLGKSIPPNLGYYCIRGAYLQSKLRPKLIDSDKSLDVYSRKRSNSDELQRKAEEKYDDIQW